jgi:hypothetical protein
VVGVRAFLLACLVMVSFSGCLGDPSPEAEASLIDALVGDDEAEETEPTPEAEATPPAPAAEEPAAEAEPTVPAPAAEPAVVVRSPRFSFALAELFLAQAGASGSPEGNPLDALANAQYNLDPDPQPVEPDTADAPAADAPAAAPTAPAAAPEVSLCPTDDEAIAAGPVYFSETGGGQWVYAEDNGMAGLQRDDESFPTACPTPDLLIF